MKRGNKNMMFSRCIICFYYIILLLATTIPTSHQIRNSHEFENKLKGVHNGGGMSSAPQTSPEMRQSEGISNEREVLDRRVCGGLGPTSSFPVKLIIQDDHVIIDNGIVQMTLSKPGGFVAGIRYNDLDNLLEVENKRDDRGYWDLNWGSPGGYVRITGTKFTVMKDDGDQVEISFTTTWVPSLEAQEGLIPLNIDRRFIMMRGCSGFYSYAIYEHLEGWPDFELGETRMVFKLRKDKFHYMAMSDERQRVMPMPEDRSGGKKLAYPEAVLLTNPTNNILKGEVDDKYQYSCDDKDNKVHGWISSDPSVGFWIITPSSEFRTGGPLKQDLTSHVGPTALAMFISGHYTGDDLELKFQNGEPWKKVFGPVFIYLNSVSDVQGPYTTLWDDAKAQMMIEVQSWPYNFPVSEDFPRSNERGSVIGRLLVRNRYNVEKYIWAGSAYIGLAPLGEAGSWQREAKGYQFWTQAEGNGSFSIRNVRAGEYNLFGWVPGFIGDYRYHINLTISPGVEIDLGDLVYEPPRDGPTLWEIGIPDRSAAEFYIPDPNPDYINRLYVNHIESNGKPSRSIDKFRQYGLWTRYTDLYPDSDLIYTVGVSDYTKDWFFAQPTRINRDRTFEATTWQIKFILENLCITRTYKLRLALASATYAELHVDFNIQNPFHPHFTTGLIGKDNAIARHGIHGLYWLFSVDVPSYRLVEGENTIFLTQSRGSGPFIGIMYDYIRLEGPSQIDYCKN